jgi:hypothetical protein
MIVTQPNWPVASDTAAMNLEFHPANYYVRAPRVWAIPNVLPAGNFELHVYSV